MKYNIDRNNINNCDQNNQHYGGHPRHINNQSVANLVASYGVYHEVHTHNDDNDDEDDAGFLPNASNPRNYPEMVVNTTGRTTLMLHNDNDRNKNNRNERNELPESCARVQEDNTNCGLGCGWCCSNNEGSSAGQSENNTGWLDCCKPSVLILILIILILVFILVSGALIYINYVAYRPKHSYTEEPCEKTFCAWGAQCVTGPDGKAHCQCPTYCRPHVEPVCGSDGRTYDNHCQLRVASCRARVNTKISYVGKCEVRDPCTGRECGLGEHCIASLDGRNATCRCVDECPSKTTPVCGSDGVDYRNECELQASVCRSKQDVVVKYKGKCDPCLGIICSNPEICQLDDHRNPVCRCGEICPLEFDPVCASDGKTYSNECVLKQEGCRARKTLNIIYRGKCSSGVNPCASVNCSTLEECTINKFGIALCECPPKCEPIVRPVCTEDGRTHASECEAKRIACLSRRNNHGAILHSGVCGVAAPCARHSCHFGAICQMTDEGKPVCVCPPLCPAAFDPVCGTDGASYGNDCKLKKEACLKQKDIGVLYKGPCDGCENKQCDFYAICTEIDKTARCVCPKLQQCDLFNATVCGTDGVTYPNECALRVAACEVKQYVLVAYKGDCDLCAGAKECDTDNSELVCATDGVTYRNECELRRAACRSEAANIEIVFYGDCGERYSVAATQAPSLLTSQSTNQIALPTNQPDLYEICQNVHCDHHATCELGPDNFPRCVCRFNCSITKNQDFIHADVEVGPICASDLRIYPSVCDMKMAACEKQQELRLRPLDLCQGMEVKPCNGDQPITDVSSGLELDCGNGPLRKDCPSGSYCHQTNRFSKCCKKDHGQSASNCEDTWYGCCLDGKTSAQGFNQTGCPIFCGCNKLGSYSDVCDLNTGTCSCRPGVGGDKCDRCEPGYWGLPKISSGHQGCIPCGCSPIGSVREDCEQMTGRCVCKSGVQGQKCTICTEHNKILTPNGCVTSDQLSITGTEWPLRRYTPLEFTQSDDANSPLSKSTRHLMVMVPNPRWYYEHKPNQYTSDHINTHNLPPLKSIKPTLSTLSTIKQITPLLGDLCSGDKDCVILNSHCYQKSCHCRPKYLESPDRQECIPDSGILTPGLPDVSYRTPSFDNGAYIRLKPLNGYHKLSIEVEFKTMAKYGILLYAQQDISGKGDFVSLGINNGYIEFKYNLGDGPAVITSLEQVTLNNWHKVTAKRYHRDGMLQLDDGENVAGQSQGKLRALDLQEDTFIGFVPSNYSKVYQNIGVYQGFKGCIRKLKLGRKDFILSEKDEDVVKVYKIQECGQEKVREDFDQVKSNLNTLMVPEGVQSYGTFNGHGFVRLPTPGNLSKSFVIELMFKSHHHDGLLLYVGQLISGKGDFLSLALVKRRVQFRFNLGSGIANLTSGDPIILHHWYRVKITRNGRDGSLQVVNSFVPNDLGNEMVDVVRGRSGAPLTELNLGMPLYIGAVQFWKEIHPLAGIKTGFKGEINQISINTKPVHIFDDSKMAECNIKTSQNIPCLYNVEIHNTLKDNDDNNRNR